MTLDLTHLRSLLERATPRPWKTDTGVYQDPDGDDDLSFARGPMVHRKPGESFADHVKRAHQDSALIAAAVNALPELLDEVERLRADLDKECEAFETARDGGYRLRDQRDSALAEVEKLRAALREACETIEDTCAMAVPDNVARLRALAGDKP